METISLLKTNSSPLSKWRRSFHEIDNLRCTRSANFIPSFRSFAAKYHKFTPSSRFSCFKVQSFTRSISNLTTKVNPAVPFNLDDAQFRNSEEKSVIDNIYETIKYLKLPAVLMLQSFLLVMLMYGRNSALARSIAEQNVSVVTAETLGSQSSSNCCCRKTCAKEDDDLLTPEEACKIINFLLLLMVVPTAIIIAYKMNQFGVIKLQVVLRGERRCEIIALTADTSTAEGRSETVHRISTRLIFITEWDYGYSSVKMFSRKEDAEKYFNHLSTNERGRFDEQLINIDKVERERIIDRELDSRGTETSVLTMLVIAKGAGVPFLPNNITHGTHLSDTFDQLRKLSDFGEAEVHAVNILCGSLVGRRLSTEEIRRDHLSDHKSFHHHMVIRQLLALTQRVQKVRDEIEHLMDDDGDMAEMYLTEKKQRLEAYSSNDVHSQSNISGLGQSSFIICSCFTGGVNQGSSEIAKGI